MGIEFLKNENIFHLSGGDVSYILKIYKNAFQNVIRNRFRQYFFSSKLKAQLIEGILFNYVLVF